MPMPIIFLWIDPEVGHLLQLLTALHRPQQILEIGTAIGCSTIYMARAMQGTITTIELQEERYLLALDYFKLNRAGFPYSCNIGRCQRTGACFGAAV